jgi:hypothetical protein
VRTDNPWVLWGCEWFSSGTAIGTAAGTAGDVNADGFDDIVIGGTGLAYVIYGSGTGLPIRPNSSGEGTITGSTLINSFNTGDGTGMAACGAGDLNGDGYADVLIGSPFDDTYATDCGYARALLGSASGLQTGSTFWEESSTFAFAHFGGTLSSAGDLNGDGLADILVGEASSVGVFQSVGTIMLATFPISISGASRSFCTAGDVDGDGLSDIVVGDGSYSNGQSLEGRLAYYAGRGDGPTASPSWSFKAMLETTDLGWSVSSAGDVNGDGIDDFITGAPTLPNIAAPGEANNGAVFMNFGKVGGPTPSFTDWSFVGSPEDQVGVSMASAYDINGDGYGDFVVGATKGPVGNGKALVFYGHANPWSSTSSPNVTLNGTQVGGGFGTTVTAGDFNGDGYADVAVGANFNNGPGNVPTQAGQVFIYLGGPGGLATTPAQTLTGSENNEHFGSTVVGDADVNGDGYTDLVVGAPDHDVTGQADAGALYEFHGGTGSTPLTLYQRIDGSSAGWRMGQALARAGDVNGDGFGDIINGMANAAGGFAEVYAGTSGGLATTPLWKHGPIEAGTRFGSAVSSAGDVNGDGLSDIVVGAVFEDAADRRPRLVRDSWVHSRALTPLRTAFGSLTTRTSDIPPPTPAT